MEELNGLINFDEHLPESSRRSSTLTNPVNIADPSTDTLVRFYLLSRLFYLDQKMDYAILVTAAMTLQFVFPSKVKPKSISKEMFHLKLLENFEDFRSNYNWIYHKFPNDGNELNMESLQSVDWFELWFGLKTRINSSDYSRLHREALESLIPGVLVLSLSIELFRKMQHAIGYSIYQELSIKLNWISDERLDFVLYEYRTEIEIDDARHIYDTIHRMFGTIRSHTFQKAISFDCFPGVGSFKIILDCFKRLSYLPWNMASESNPDEWHALLVAYRLYDGQRYIGLVDKLKQFRTKQFGQIALIAKELGVQYDHGLANFVICHTMSERTKEIVNYFRANQCRYLKKALKDANHRHHQLTKTYRLTDQDFPILLSFISELAVPVVDGENGGSDDNGDGDPLTRLNKLAI